MSIRARALAALAAGALATTVAAMTAASAADLYRTPPVAPVKTPLPPALFSWSGCYIGGFLGGAWSKDPVFTDQGNTLFAAYSGGLTAPRVEGTHSWTIPLGSSVIGGGTVGCNWQPFASAFVLGVEGEAGFISMTASEFDPLVAPTVPVSAVRRTADVLGTFSVGDWYGMVTGRLGYAFDRTLFYVKGGVAFVPVSASVLDQCAVVAAGCGNATVLTSSRDTVTTWTAGGGIEVAFGLNWSVKAEYMFIGDVDAPRSCGAALDATGAVVAGGDFCFSHALDGIHTAKVGLNYRFNPFNPFGL